VHYEQGTRAAEILGSMMLHILVTEKF